MRKRITSVLIIALGAVGITATLVPQRTWSRRAVRSTLTPPVPPQPQPETWTLVHTESGPWFVQPWAPVKPHPRWRWIWERPTYRPIHAPEYGMEHLPLTAEARVEWPLVLVEHSLILLLSGMTITWLVRRERRRQAAE